MTSSRQVLDAQQLSPPSGSGFPAVPGTSQNLEPVPRFRPVPDRFPEPVKLSGSRFPVLTGEPREPVTAGLATGPVPREVIQKPEPVAVAGIDVLKLPAALFGRLPFATSLLCQLRGTPVRFIVTGSRSVWEALRATGGVVFGTLELEALTCGAANDRANTSSLSRWCAWKRQEPTWRVNLDDVLDGLVAVVDAPVDLTLGRVLQAWGAELVAVSYGDEVPA